MQEEKLKKYWEDLTGRYNEPSLMESIYKDLKAQYTSTKRHYHNLEHIASMLSTIETFKEEIEDYTAVSFAIWFHDVIYNPMKSDNEAQSALFALQALKPFNIPASTLNKIQNMILATANHMNRQENEDADIQLFLDTDLKIIGSPRKEYVRYMDQVRKEYQWVPDILYKPGRKKAMKRFYQAEFIYRTDHFRNLYEKQAKENILFELEQL